LQLSSGSACRRPVIVALAGANGAGKSTYYHSHLEAAGLRFVYADLLARKLSIDP
jgi:predicted ABC-type ATPase